MITTSTGPSEWHRKCPGEALLELLPVHSPDKMNEAEGIGRMLDRFRSTSHVASIVQSNRFEPLVFKQTHIAESYEKGTNSDKKRGNRFLNYTHRIFFQSNTMNRWESHCPPLTWHWPMGSGRLLDEPQRESGGYTRRPVVFLAVFFFVGDQTIPWGYPPPINSETIICSFLWRDPYKPSLSTVFWAGDTPKLSPFIWYRLNNITTPLKGWIPGIINQRGG